PVRRRVERRRDLPDRDARDGQRRPGHQRLAVLHRARRRRSAAELHGVRLGRRRRHEGRARDREGRQRRRRSQPRRGRRHRVRLLIGSRRGSTPRSIVERHGSAGRLWPVPRGDGLLTHELDPHDAGPQDACGVFGVWAPGEEVAKLTYFGLSALQHRGQESAGIAVSNGRQILVYKDMGLVSQVFDEATLESLAGEIAIGHTRYSTTGASVWQNAQPTFRPTAQGSIALGHNGNLTNTHELVELLRSRTDGGARSKGESATSDTSVMASLMASYRDRSIEDAAMEVLPHL